MVEKLHTPAGGRASDWWKTIAVALLSVLGSFGGFWFTIGKDVPSRIEVAAMIKTNGPYVEDRKLIISKLDANESTNRDLSTAINSLTRELSGIRAVHELLLERERKKGSDK